MYVSFPKNCGLRHKNLNKYQSWMTQNIHSRKSKAQQGSSCHHWLHILLGASFIWQTRNRLVHANGLPPVYYELQTFKYMLVRMNIMNQTKSNTVYVWLLYSKLIWSFFCSWTNSLEHTNKSGKSVKTQMKYRCTFWRILNAADTLMCQNKSWFNI